MWAIKTWKNSPQKLLIIDPIFFQYWSGGPNTAKQTKNRKFRTIKSPVMQDWVFALGLSRHSRFPNGSRYIFQLICLQRGSFLSSLNELGWISPIMHCIHFEGIKKLTRHPFMYSQDFAIWYLISQMLKVF